MKERPRPLRVAIDARLIPGEMGGVEQTIIGLAQGLSKLTEDGVEYLFLTHGNSSEWIRPHLNGACRVLAGPPAIQARRRAWRTNRVARFILHDLSVYMGYRAVAVPCTDGTIETAKIDVVHFSLQTGFETSVPSVYTIQDLQHLHLPQLFTPRQRLAREKLYRFFCSQARYVITPSSWSRSDLLEHYGLPQDKVYVVPWAAVSESHSTPSREDMQRTRTKFSLPDSFLFYPAQTWAHKNHLTLLDALVKLRDERGLRVPLICAGRMAPEFQPRIESKIRQFQLNDQVRFIGFVRGVDLQCLYALSRCMIFPSKFEGFGMPVVEAFQAGIPVACSNVTCLPKLADDAALIFHPDSVADIARAIQQLWTDEQLRASLVGRGRARAAAFTWSRTARTLLALWRKAAGIALSEQDRELLAAPSPV